MTDFTAAQVETIKQYGGSCGCTSYDRLFVLSETYINEIGRAYSWAVGNGTGLCYDVDFVKSALYHLTDGSEYSGKSAEELLANYERWIVDVSDDEWTPDSEEVRLVRAWLTADPFVYFLYGYAVTEMVADAARDYATSLALHEGGPNFDKVVDDVTEKFLKIFKKAVS